ncbi:MAG: alpha/beta fold hydrolase [Parvibaculaceae bacterium]
MPRVLANRIDIEYESFGADDAETILLIMGLGAQLTQWPLELCEALVARGYRVIRFDNRDAGLSARMERDSAFAFSDVFFALASGKSAFAPYSLSDMAADAVGLLDALGIRAAHIVGASMGGMVAQHVAAEYPAHVLSLTSIMSSSGNPLLPPPRPKVLSLFMSHGQSRDAEAVIARGIKTYEVIGSPGFPTDADTLREWVTRDASRAYYPQGVMRQMAAVLSDGDRRSLLRRIDVPSVVVHGRADPLVPMAAGEDTAAHISGAELRIIDGMGHDMPLALVPQIVDAIIAAAERATGVQLVEEVAAPEAAAAGVVEIVSGVVAAADVVPKVRRFKQWWQTQRRRFRFRRV